MNINYVMIKFVTAPLKLPQRKSLLLSVAKNLKEVRYGKNMV